MGTLTDPACDGTLLNEAAIEKELEVANPELRRYAGLLKCKY